MNTNADCSVDTPRTRERKELRNRRLAYFETINKPASNGGASQSFKPQNSQSQLSKPQQMQNSQRQLSNGQAQDKLKDKTDAKPSHYDGLDILRDMHSDTRVMTPNAMNSYGKIVKNGDKHPNYPKFEDYGVDDTAGIHRNIYKSDIDHVKNQVSHGYTMPGDTVCHNAPMEMKVERRGYNSDNVSKPLYRNGHVMQESHAIPNQQGAVKVSSDIDTSDELSSIVALSDNNFDIYKYDYLSKNLQVHPSLNKLMERNKRPQSPSRESGISDFTISALTLDDDDLTHVTSLGFSTHRPSEASMNLFIPEDTRPSNPNDAFTDYPILNSSDHGKDKSSPIEKLDNSSLESVLGRERFTRLMQNFHDSDCASDDESEFTDKTITNHNLEPHGHPRQCQSSNTPFGHDITPLDVICGVQNDDAEELVLKTHRPSVAPSILTNVTDSQWSSHSPRIYDPNLPAAVPNTIVTRTSSQSVRCAFSSNEIYAVAHQINSYEIVESDDLLRSSSPYSITPDPAGLDIGRNSIVSDASSSLAGREVTMIRKKPFGPIPQKPKQNDSKNGVSQQIIEPPRHHPQESKPLSPKLHESTKLVEKAPILDAPNMKNTKESLQRYFTSLQAVEFESVPEPEILDTPRRGLAVTGYQMVGKSAEPTNSDDLRPYTEVSKNVSELSKHPVHHARTEVEINSDDTKLPSQNMNTQDQSDEKESLTEVEAKLEALRTTVDDFDTSSSLATSKLLKPTSDIDSAKGHVQTTGLLPADLAEVKPVPNGTDLFINQPDDELDDEPPAGILPMTSQQETQSLKQYTQSGYFEEELVRSSQQENQPVKQYIESGYFKEEPITSPADESEPSSPEADDLHSKVTSIVSGMGNASGLTERMEKLGINFDFLKKPQTGYEVDEVLKVRTEESDILSDDCEIARNKVDAINDKLHPSKSSGLPIASVSEMNKQNKMTDMVKVCPECAGINRPYMDWCTECGEIMIGVNPVPTKLKKAERNTVKKFLEEDAAIAAKHSHMKERNQGESSQQGKGYSIFVRQSTDTITSDVRDSDSFQYEASKKPNDSLTPFLKAELSLDLRNSSSTITSTGDTHDNDVNKKKSKARKKTKPAKGPDMAEDVEFEYEASEIHNQSIPSPLRVELSLNLRDSVDSNQGHTSARKNKVAAKPKSGYTPKKCKSPVIIKQNQNPVVAADDEESKLKKLENSDNYQESLDPSENSNDIYRGIVARLLNENFKPSNSTGKPNQTVSKKKARPNSANSATRVTSKVRQSLEAEPYQRRWETSRATWSGSGGVSSPSLAIKSLSRSRDRPSSPNVVRSMERPSSANARPQRPSSASVTRSSLGHAMRAVRHALDDSAITERSDNGQIRSPNQRPASAGRIRTHPMAVVSKSIDQRSFLAQKSMARSREKVPTAKSSPNQINGINQPNKAWVAFEEDPGKYPGLAEGYTSKLYVKDNIVHPCKRPKRIAYLDNYDVSAMSPRIHVGELSMILCLPDELMLYILSFLSHADLMRCAQVSAHFKRVALDSSLWKKIMLKKKTLTDAWIIEIGSKEPTSLSLIQCDGSKVSANGLRELFRQCSESLEELNVTGCTTGYLTGDRLLLHASTHQCANLKYLDASWSNIDDCGLMAIADTCHKLHSVCINGCPSVTDEAVHSVVGKHGSHLRTLELFGCFNLTEVAVSSITENCKRLVTLNLGQCWRLTDTCLTQLTASLGQVENLDLRGCKQITDTCVRQIVCNCPKLRTLALANCPSITDSALAEIASLSPQVTSLDFCGCKKLTDTGIRAIAMGCGQLEYLDVSSTAVTQKGVSLLASYCNRSLEVVKFNFCKNITLNSLVRLARNCMRLKKLYLYGLTTIRNVDEIRQANPSVWIELSHYNNQTM